MEEQIKVLIYGNEDIKKNGKFKKSFVESWINKEEFFKYLKENKLKIKSQYIDHIGEISNNKRFRCSYKNFIIGTSKIVEEFNNLTL